MRNRLIQNFSIKISSLTHCINILIKSEESKKIFNFRIRSRTAFDKISQIWVEIVNFVILQWPGAPKAA